MTAGFDTLEYVETLTKSGIPEDQAKAHAKAILVVADNTLASKQDIQSVRHDIDLLRLEMKAEIKSAIIYIGGMLFVALGIVLAAMRYL